MNHAADGTLQAYLDGEVTGSALAELDEHLSACDACTAELERMRHESALFTGAIGLLDRELAADAAQQAYWRARAAAQRPAATRWGRGALARAAMALLVLAGAVTAALPNSPLRRLVEQWLAPDADPVVTEAPARVPAAVPAEPGELLMRGTGFVPSQGKVRVLVWSAQPSATIRVNLVDGARVSVEAGREGDEEVSFRTAPDRVEVMNLGDGQAVIEIPRSLPFASIEVDGRQWLFKDGDQLRVQGPVLEQTADAVVFRTAR